MVIAPLKGKLEMVFPPRTQIEITASYSQKVNKGNYESADYFRSRKESCEPKDAENVSRELYEWCKRQVEWDIDPSSRTKSKPERKEISKVENDNDNANW